MVSVMAPSNVRSCLQETSPLSVPETMAIFIAEQRIIPLRLSSVYFYFEAPGPMPDEDNLLGDLLAYSPLGGVPSEYSEQEGDLIYFAVQPFATAASGTLFCR